jgi:hypothetical protein
MRSFQTALAALRFLALAGCASQKPAAIGPGVHPIMKAAYTRDPITLDGKLDEDVWQRATAYPLQLPAGSSDLDKLYDPRVAAGESKPWDGGEVRLAWDDKYLYVAVKFEDSDVVAEGTEDQLHQYRMGDTAELFLKPADQTWMWEMYATPAGHKTAFFYPGPGRSFLPSVENYHSRLKVAAHVDGSLNQWHDRDNGWSAEFAVPLDELRDVGEPLAPGKPWLILVARYNYSRYLGHLELSSAPRLPWAAFMLYEYYGKLELVK